MSKNAKGMTKDRMDNTGDARKGGNQQQKRFNSHKEYGIDGYGPNSRANAPGGGRSVKAAGTQSGDDKSQSQLEESLGAIVGSGIKKTGLNQHKGSQAQGSSNSISKVQERLNRAQKNR